MIFCDPESYIVRIAPWHFANEMQNLSVQTLALFGIERDILDHNYCLLDLDLVLACSDVFTIGVQLLTVYLTAFD